MLKLTLHHENIHTLALYCEHVGIDADADVGI